MSLPTTSSERKRIPMYSGLLKYFPDALALVAHVSFVGNEQHNPGEPLHWAKEKSTDHEDCIIRHMADKAAGHKFDPDGERVAAKVAWRALAALQIELDEENNHASVGLQVSPMRDGGGDGVSISGGSGPAPSKVREDSLFQGWSSYDPATGRWRHF